MENIVKKYNWGPTSEAYILINHPRCISHSKHTILTLIKYTEPSISLSNSWQTEGQTKTLYSIICPGFFLPNRPIIPNYTLVHSCQRSPIWGGQALILDQSPSYQCLPWGRPKSPSFTNIHTKSPSLHTIFIILNFNCYNWL